MGDMERGSSQAAPKGFFFVQTPANPAAPPVAVRVLLLPPLSPWLLLLLALPVDKHGGGAEGGYQKRSE